MEATSYPGVGADEALAELHQLMGEIAANWASVEDQLFQVFVIALAGSLMVQDFRPYRAVFFSVNSFQAKMRMLDAAMRARYGDNEKILADWKEIKGSLNGLAAIRNQVAHTVPMVLYSTDPAAKANVRLVPPFWKSTLKDDDFDKLGYSLDELWQALAPYWGYHPRTHGLNAPSGGTSTSLGYRIQQFAIQLAPPRPSSKADPSNP